MKNTLRTLILLSLSLSACSSVSENVAVPSTTPATDLSQSSLEELVQHLSFGAEQEKQEAAYRIGALAVVRNNAIVQSELTGEACPDKKDFLIAVPALQAALKSRDGKLQYEAASTLMAIGPLNELTANGLSNIAASNDPNLKRALAENVHYLFIPPCQTSTPTPAAAPAAPVTHE